jgi:quercetin dioxygenase-like cupin family protein
MAATTPVNVKQRPGESDTMLKNVIKTNEIPALLKRSLIVCALLTLSGATWAGDPAHEPALAIGHSDAGLQWGPCPEFFGEGCHIAVLHGDPSKPNSDVLFRLAGGKPFPAHRHTSAERMVLVAGVMDVTYEGQETAQLTAGMYAYGPAQRVHHGACVSEEDCVLFIAFEQPVDATQVATE